MSGALIVAIVEASAAVVVAAVAIYAQVRHRKDDHD